MDQQLREAREELRKWLNDERVFYADQKYDDDLRAHGFAKMGEEGVAPESYWADFVLQYFHRAQTFGIDTPQGRQAFGKFIVTAMSCLEAAIVAHGPMPLPGKPSGEVLPNAPTRP